MWRGILQGNRDELLAALAGMKEQIAAAEQLLERNDDAGLRNLLAVAKTSRDGIIRKARYGGN
jgi:prephenate dehydrogenase